MDLTAKDLMQTEVKFVDPDDSLVSLERAFIDGKVGGFPVVDDRGSVVGVVSRTDIGRQLGIEQSVAEYVSDYYRGVGDFDPSAAETLTDIGARVGHRIEQLRVRDVMTRKVIGISPETSLPEVAKTLIDNNIHRVIVTENGKLVGIVSALDLVRILAERAS